MTKISGPTFNKQTAQLGKAVGGIHQWFTPDSPAGALFDSSWVDHPAFVSRFRWLKQL